MHEYTKNKYKAEKEVIILRLIFMKRDIPL